jgi:hypothetical protein
MGRAEAGDSNPTVNERGGAWVLPGEVRAVPEPEHVILIMYFL